MSVDDSCPEDGVKYGSEAIFGLMKKISTVIGDVCSGYWRGAGWLVYMLSPHPWERE